MIDILLTIAITNILLSLFGYLAHKSLHQTWAGRFSKSHMTHHNVLYPPDNYLSDSYRSAGGDSTLFTFMKISLPLIIIPIIAYFTGILSLLLTVIILIEMAVFAAINDYLHDSFHIRNHFLTRIPIIKAIFNRLVMLHLQHHLDMDTNYGIYSFIWDRVFGTYTNINV